VKRRPYDASSIYATTTLRSTYATTPAVTPVARALEEARSTLERFFNTNIGSDRRAVKDENSGPVIGFPIVAQPGGDVVFVINALREFQPDLAARVETEIVEGAATSDDAGPLECRVTERDQDGRTLIVVSLAGQGWTVTFTVSQPPAAGEVRMETRKVLRDRDRRSPYGRATRREG